MLSTRADLKTGLLLTTFALSSVFFYSQKMTLPVAEADDAASPVPTVSAAVTSVPTPPAVHVQLQASASPAAPIYTVPPANIETPLPSASPEPTELPSPAPAASPLPSPAAVFGTFPGEHGYTTTLEICGEAVESFLRETPVSFGSSDYFALPGVATFRGGNDRQNAACGTVDELSGTFKKLWSVKTGYMNKSGSGTWSGSGWTGQPLLVQWSESTRRVMNLYDEYKAKDGWVEVIYATMDGNVYFLDLETGRPTRDKLSIGIPFKGAGSLDPRGWPVLYLGTGDTYAAKAKKGRAMAISLLDFSRLWEVGIAKDKFALRNWTAYDSAILVDAASDTALIPGENGILYSLSMHTVYDEAAGTLTMTPDPVVKQRYEAPRVGPDRAGKFYYGYESSAATWKQYAFLCGNDGYIRCIDLNTMEAVWVQDLGDDINATPALDETETGLYLYVGNTVDRTMKRQKGTASFYKLNALTGEILWRFEQAVTSTDNITGGVMSSAVLGKNELSGLVFTTFASTYGDTKGELYAFDTTTGEVVWHKALDTYTWSSPLALYTDAGKGYLLLFDHKGKGYLLDGRSGATLGNCKLSENIEASPCAFGDLIVIGTRDRHIYGLRVS